MTTDKTIKSKYQPKQTNVTWIDLSGETPIEKHFINGGWVATSSGGSGGTTDYSSLKNKPSIDGVELNGDKSFSDLTDGKLYGGTINTQSTVQPDTSCYYIAEEGGTYQAFGVTVNANERVQIIVHNGTSWEVVSLNMYNYSYAHGKFDKLDDIDATLTEIVPSSASSSNKLLTENERHFKGWFNSLAELKAAHTATEGDSAYVKDASPATTWSIYVYDTTATTDNNWADSGTDVDTSNVQTFASGEEVNEVRIVNDLTTGGVDDVLSAEQGKVLNDNKLSKTIEDDTFYVTDSNGYVICKIDANGVHAPNIQDNGGGIVIDNNKLLVTDANGYIVLRVDNNGIHSVVDKHAVACMVLSENYYPTSTPTRDSNGNVTHANVMFGTGVAGEIDIIYTNGNASYVVVEYSSKQYAITINRDINGNVTTVSVAETD